MRTKLIMVVSLVLLALSAVVIAQTDLDEYSILRADVRDNENPHKQVKAMKKLSMMADVPSVPDIEVNLDSPFLDIRLNALRAVGRYNDPANLPLFENIILQVDQDYTIQERVVAIKSYKLLPGFDENVIRMAFDSASPTEYEMMTNALGGAVK